MIFLIAVSALFFLIAVNILAIATLASSAWTASIALVERRHRSCRWALYLVPAVAVGKHILLSILSPSVAPPLGATVFGLVLAGILPLFAYNRASRALLQVGIRDLVSGRD